MLEKAQAVGEQSPHSLPPDIAGTPQGIPRGIPDRFPEEWTPAVERRQHRRAPPPSVLNGAAYSLRASAVAAPLVVSDLTALLLSLLVADAVVGAMLPGPPFSSIAVFAVLAVGLVFGKAALGLYPGIGVPPFVELTRSSLAISLLVGAFILAGFLQDASATSQWVLFVTGITALVLTPALRSLTRRTFARFSWWRQPLLVFDTGRAAQRVSTYFKKNPGLGLRPVLVKPDLRANGARGESPVAVLAARHRAVCAAVPLDGAPQPRTSDLLRECANTFPHLLVVPDMGEILNTWGGATNVGGLAGIRAGKSLLLPVPRAVKRAVDWILALLLGLLCLPLVLVIAIVIKLTSPGPTFYGQERIGRDRKPFLAWKFRTMYANADELLDEYLVSSASAREEWAKDHKLRDDPRVTPVGRALRRTSLDELPQLWNVLRGEMSLVGPRPIVEEEARKYGTDFGRYLSVPPGLTGLWQVSGRNRTTYEERIRLDSFYVENWSLMLDSYILAKTVKAVVTGDGAY